MRFILLWHSLNTSIFLKHSFRPKNRIIILRTIPLSTHLFEQFVIHRRCRLILFKSKFTGCRRFHYGNAVLWRHHAFSLVLLVNLILNLIGRIHFDFIHVAETLWLFTLSNEEAGCGSGLFGEVTVRKINMSYVFTCSSFEDLFFMDVTH